MEFRDVITKALGESIVEMCQAVLGEAPQIKHDHIAEFDGNSKIIATIGLSGSVHASLSFLISTANGAKVLSKMLGMEIAEDSQDLIDGSGELANMAAGGVKMRLQNTPYKLELSIPTVITAKDPVHLSKLRQSESIEILATCQTVCFEVVFTYTLKEDPAPVKDGTQSTAAEQALKNLRASMGLK